MVSANAKDPTKQRPPLSPLSSTNGALPQAAADPFYTAISDSSIVSAKDFVEMVKKPPTNAGLKVHAKGQSRMEATCCNVTLGVWRMDGQLLIPAGQGCKYRTLKQDYSVTHTCSPNDLNAFYWEVYKLAMQEKPGYTFEMVELGPENSKGAQCCPCFDSEKANLDADDEHPVADALTNVYVAQRPAFKKRSDPSANTLTVLAPHLREKYSEEGSRFKSIFAAATSTCKIKDTTAEPLTQLVQAAKDEASQAKLFGVRRHTQPPRRLGSRVAQPPHSRRAAAAQLPRLLSRGPHHAPRVAPQVASQSVVSLMAKSVEMAADLTEVKRMVAGHYTSIAAQVTVREQLGALGERLSKEADAVEQAAAEQAAAGARALEEGIAQSVASHEADEQRRAAIQVSFRAWKVIQGLDETWVLAQLEAMVVAAGTSTAASAAACSTSSAVEDDAAVYHL